MASRFATRVAEEDNAHTVIHESTTHSRSRGKQPAVLIDENTPLITAMERDAIHQEIEDDFSSEYESIILPDMTYAQVIRSFALVPLTCFVLFVGLVLLITFAWAPLPDFPHSNVLYPYQPHARAFLVGAAGWIVAYSSRGAIYALVTLGGRWASLTSVVLSTILSVAAQEVLRLGVLVLLGVRLHAWAGHPEWVPYPTPQDESFRDVWWVALGWSTIEAALSIFQGYEQLSLYKELFDARDRDEETRHNTNTNRLQIDSRAISRSAGSSAAEEDAKRAAALSPSDMASLMDDELNHSIQLRDREALELVFGVPLPNIPVFISCLQRVDAQILSIGFTLLISAAYVSDNRTNLFRGLIFGLVAVLHFILTIVWAEALPRIGIHTACYTSLLVAIGTFLAGLAFWGALE